MGLIENRIERVYKDKSSKEKKDIANSAYLIIGLLIVSAIFALSGFAIIFLIMLLLYPLIKKKLFKVFSYMLILNIFITLFFVLNNGHAMDYVGVFDGNVKENYSSSTNFFYSNWRNYMFNNDSIGFKKRVDYLTKYGTDRYERDRPDWVSGYEHFENDKWYTSLAKGTYNTLIGDYLNPDPVLEGEVPTVSGSIDY